MKNRRVVILTENEAALLSEGVHRLMASHHVGPGVYYSQCKYCYEGATYAKDIPHKSDCQGFEHLTLLKQLVPDPFNGT